MGRKHCFLKAVSEEDPEAQECSAELVNRRELSPEEVRILRITSGCKRSVKCVCRVHLKQFLYDYPFLHTTCCDPFQDHASKPPPSKKLKKAARALHEIDLALRDKAKAIGLLLIPGKKLCISCKVKLYSQLTKIKRGCPNPVEEQAELPRSSQSVLSSQETVSTPLVENDGDTRQPEEQGAGHAIEKQLSLDTSSVDLELLNKWLSNHGLTPISLIKMKKQESYGDKVLSKLKLALQKCATLHFKEDKNSIHYSEMVEQLQDFISNNTSNSKKVLALTVLPKSMSYAMIVQTFGVSNYMARKSRAIVQSHGILCEPGTRLGRYLPVDVVNKVLSFYYRDDVSRPLPGRKDVVSVKVGDQRIIKRKRLVLGTLASLHTQYLEDNPSHPISRGKFCALRPKECVLAGQSGTHVICVCTYHENPALMFEHGQLKSENLQAVKDCRALMLCSNPNRECFLRKCEECPQIKLQETLELHFDSEMIDTVTYSQWETTDRGNMVTLTDTTDDFITNFVSQIEIVIPHDFVYKEQTKFFRNLMETLEEGEVVVSLDFGENFTVVIQRSGQSNYFKATQITVHPFIAYYRENGELKHTILVIISDHLDHSTASVHVYQKKLINFLEHTLTFKVKKVYYQSDGCAGQYKNKKNVANLWFHEADFGMPAEWHYQATSHGKSACDGITGRVKQLVQQHSLQATKPEDLITNAKDMAKWLERNVTGVTTVYVPSSEVVAHELELIVRFGTALDIEGIQSHHAIIPKKGSPYVQMKLLSNDDRYVLRQVSIRETQYSFEDVKGFVMYSDDKKNIKLGNVTESDEISETYTVQVLSLKDKLTYEFSDESADIFLGDVLCLVTPYFQKRGTVVKVYAKDFKSAEVKLRAGNQR